MEQSDDNRMTMNPNRVRELLRTPTAKPRRIDNLGRHVSLKLWKEQRDEIRRRRDAGESGKALAAEFGVSQAYVSMIWNGRR